MTFIVYTIWKIIILITFLSFYSHTQITFLYDFLFKLSSYLLHSIFFLYTSSKVDSPLHILLGREKTT